MSATASVAAFPFRSAPSHLRKVRSFPAKSSHLRKVSSRAMSATASIAAFPFRSATSHLRKVCSFPTFSAHLPKVSTSVLSTTAGKCRNWCRCGKGTGEAMPSRKPIARIRRKRSSATAENRWNWCRCGKGPKRQWRPEGLLQGYGGKEVPQRQRNAESAAVV